MDAKEQLMQAALEMAERNGIPEERREAFVREYLEFADSLGMWMREMFHQIGDMTRDLIERNKGGEDDGRETSID